MIRQLATVFVSCKPQRAGGSVSTMYTDRVSQERGTSAVIENSSSKKLTEYRDCIQHYVPVDFGLASMWMNQVLPGVWSASARIPDNPETKSKASFRFTRKLDALSFAWEVAVEVHRVIDLVLHLSNTEDEDPQGLSV